MTTNPPNSTVDSATLYEQDYYLWVETQVKLLQQGELEKLDLAWIIHKHFVKSVKACAGCNSSNLHQKQCVFENAHSVKGLALGE